MTDKESEAAEWFVYMIRCAGGQLYTGIATNVERRLAEHEAGKGAKYLRGKGPLQLVYTQDIGSRSEALKAEAAMKRLTRAQKQALLDKQTRHPNGLGTTDDLR